MTRPCRRLFAGRGRWGACIIAAWAGASPAEAILLSAAAAPGGGAGVAVAARWAQAEPEDESPLHELARRQRGSPDLRAMEAPPPPGVDASAVATLDGPMLRLNEALEAAPGLAAAPEAAPVPATTAESDAALRLYLSARQQLAAGDARSAARALESACRLDPTSPVLRERLAEALEASGHSARAGSARAAAVGLGSRSPALLVLHAADLMAQGEAEGALASAREALRRAEPARDGLPGVERSLALLTIGEALLLGGQPLAGAEALAQGLSQLQGSAAGALQPALSRALRRRGELWTRAGDAFLRAGRPIEAHGAYESASALPVVDPGSLLARRLLALARAGRSADAGQLIVQAAVAPGGGSDARLAGLARWLASTSEAGPALAESLRRAEAPGGSSSRVLAATLPPDEAREVLLLRLTLSPRDGGALRDYFATLTGPRGAAGDAARALAQLAGAGPWWAEESARAMLTAGFDGPAVLRSLEELPAGTEVLSARVGLARVLGEFERAGTWAAALAERAGDDAGLLALAGTAAAEAGRWALVDEITIRLRAVPSVAGRSALARLAAAQQRFGEVIEMAGARRDEEHAPGAPDPAAELLRAALACALAGRFEESVALASRAVRLDPLLEEAHALRCELVGPGGPLADPDRFGAAVRALRTALPSGASLRLLSARQLAGERRFAEAEHQLLSLAEERPGDARAGRGLVAVWRSASEADGGAAARRGLEWLDRHASALESSNWAWAARGVLLHAAGRSAEAETLLRRRLVEAPGDGESARALETILRSSGRSDDADAVAEARLRSAPPGPGTLLEFALLRAGQGLGTDAVEAVRVALSRGAEPTVEQRRVLVEIAARCGRAALEAQTASALDAALEAVDAAARHEPDLPPALHELRLALLATQPTVDVERLRAAALGAMRAPELADAHERAATMLAAAGRLAEALAFVDGAMTAGEGPDDDDLLALWVRLALAQGTPDDAVRAVEGVIERGRSEGVSRVLFEDPRFVPEARRPGQAAAELAHWAAMLTTDDATGERLYRVALRHDPEHALAANNLGYMLLEAGRSLEESARLLETAHRLKPDDANILDSIGWLRYHQGRLDDGPQGPGAVTLLTRASQTDSGSRNPTVWDHLGDALWRAGHRDRAISAWRSAAIRADERAMLWTERSRGGEVDPQAQRERRRAAALREKAQRAHAGQDPGPARQVGVGTDR